MILPTEEFTDIGKAELPLMTNNQCGMGFLAGYLTKQTEDSCSAPNLINRCLSSALMAGEMWCCSPHCVVFATPAEKISTLPQSSENIYFAKWNSGKNI